MKLLLDTHAFLWLIEGNPQLGHAATEAINDDQNTLFLSVASIWELAIKTSGPCPRLRLVDPLEAFVETWTNAYKISILPIEHTHAWMVRHLLDHHRDPFDRLLVAQALVESMSLLTADNLMSKYPITVIW